MRMEKSLTTVKSPNDFEMRLASTTQVPDASPSLAVRRTFAVRSRSQCARFDERASRVEMHLRSRIPQTVHIGGADLTAHFRAGETIWTESSYKFRREDICEIGVHAGWTTARQWIDTDWGFAETLFRA